MLTDGIPVTAQAYPYDVMPISSISPVFGFLANDPPPLSF